MNSSLNLPFQLRLPAPSATQAIALLDALDSHERPSEAVLDTALATPALIIALLWMTPLRPEEDSLRNALDERLRTTGPQLIRAWLMQAHRPDTDDAFLSAQASRSAHLSRLTASLAAAMGGTSLLSAQLAGLWLDAGTLCLATSISGYTRLLDGCDSDGARTDMEQEQLGTDHLQVATRLARACGLDVDIQDAILLTRLGPARMDGAHPLARVLHAAARLSDDTTPLDEIARFSGVAAATLEDLRTRYTADRARDQISAADVSYPTVPRSWQATVLAALGNELFDARPDDVGPSLGRAFRLLFCTDAPLLLREAEGHLIPFAIGSNDAGQALARHIRALDLGTDDPSSVISLSMRSQAITTQYVGRDTPSRSTKDWHLARWLGHRSLTCMPFDIAGQRGVGLIGERDDPAGITTEHRLMAQLVQHAARSHFRDALYRYQIDAHGTQIREQLMSHVRRIKHEASSPLTVLQTRLSLMADGESGGDMPVSLEEISREVARVNALLAELTETPHAAPTQAEASINAEVGRLSELYGHALFEQRGRHLDVRLPPNLPRIAIAPKALTQILLNLMRNAAEALQENGTLSIRSSGVAITGGRPCVEILLKDDGPGLPPARQQALFEAAPSTKGEDHEGVGLSIVKQLLDDHGAYIFCRTIKNQGTSFQIYIPVVDS